MSYEEEVKGGSSSQFFSITVSFENVKIFLRGILSPYILPQTGVIRSYIAKIIPVRILDNFLVDAKFLLIPCLYRPPPPA